MKSIIASIAIVALAAGGIIGVARADHNGVPDLYPGWNLVGFGPQATTPEDYAALHDECDDISIYLWGNVEQDWVGRWFSYTPDYVNTIDELVPGSAGWVGCHVDE